MTVDDLVPKVRRAICEAENGPCDEPLCVAEGCTFWTPHARAAIALIRPATLEEAAHPAFLRPLIEEQSAGEWDDKTIDRDVAMFSAAIRALATDPGPGASGAS